MIVESKKVDHHGRNVDCTCYWPDGEQRTPVVILSHGYNGHQEDAAPVAQYLAQRGIAAVCISFCGGSTRDLSGFSTSEMTLYTQRDDLLAVIAWIESTQRTSRIFLYGESMGGLTSVLASDVRGEKIAGLALLYPALCIADNWRERFPDAAVIPEFVDFWGMRLGRDFFLTCRELNVFSLLPKYKGPVLLMHGEDDETVPIAYSKKAAALYPHAEMIPFPHEGHGFTKQGRSRVCELVYQWIQDNLCAISPMHTP